MSLICKALSQGEIVPEMLEAIVYRGKEVLGEGLLLHPGHPESK